MCVIRCVLAGDVALMLCDCKCLTDYCTELELLGFSSGNRMYNHLNPQIFLAITHGYAAAIIFCNTICDINSLRTKAAYNH